MPFWLYVVMVGIDVIGVCVAAAIAYGTATKWRTLDTFERWLGVVLSILLVVVIVVGTLIDLRVLPMPGA